MPPSTQWATTVADLITLTRKQYDDLMGALRWAQDAPHHDGCKAITMLLATNRICTCGRDEALAPF